MERWRPGVSPKPICLGEPMYCTHLRKCMNPGSPVSATMIQNTADAQTIGRL